MILHVQIRTLVSGPLVPFGTEQVRFRAYTLALCYHRSRLRRIEELVAAFRGESARLSITADGLEHARQWARCHLEPWARQQREDRLARWWKEEAALSWVRVRFRGIPATNSDGACSLLEQAEICIVRDERQPVRFTVGQRRGSTCRITVLEATVLLDDSLKAV